jgi:hypothetical protein
MTAKDAIGVQADEREAVAHRNGRSVMIVAFVV